MQYVWTYFLELHSSRASNGYGINPIPFSDIFAYFQLIDVKPFQWEVQMIKRLDNIALQAYADEAAKEQQKAKAKNKK